MSFTRDCNNKKCIRCLNYKFVNTDGNGVFSQILVCNGCKSKGYHVEHSGYGELTLYKSKDNIQSFILSGSGCACYVYSDSPMFHLYKDKKSSNSS